MTYCGSIRQQSTERGFRFLKDPLFFTKECVSQLQRAGGGIGDAHGSVLTGLQSGVEESASSSGAG